VPPQDGFSIAHFLTVTDIERSAHYYEKVFGARAVLEGGAPHRLGNGFPLMISSINRAITCM
jgi:catechol 2,3-dioxygenase-like lactoylglutathione lyase family enzyme